MFSLPLSLPLPVLAFDREVIGIIAFVIWILGMIIRAVKSNQEAAPKPRRDGNGGRTEIETFLEEISGKTSPRPQAKPKPQKRPPQAKSKKPNKPLEPAANSSESNKPRRALSEQHLKTSNLGAGVRNQVSVFAQAGHVGADVQRDVPNRIAREVDADLGPRQLTSTSAPGSKRAAAHPLIQLLRDPQGVRQAIAVQEILQKPKALRRD